MLKDGSTLLIKINGLICIQHCNWGHYGSLLVAMYNFNPSSIHKEGWFKTELNQWTDSGTVQSIRHTFMWGSLFVYQTVFDWMSWAVTMDWLRPHSIRHSQLLSEWNSLSLCINFSTFPCYKYLFIPRARIKCDLKPNYMCVNLMDTKHLYWPTPVVQFYLKNSLC